MRLTASSGPVAVDVEVDEGVTVARLRARLARLTGEPAWSDAVLSADGEPLHGSHPAGRPPLVHGATLRPGPGPLPDAVAAARADLHIAVVAGPDTGTLLVPTWDPAPRPHVRAFVARTPAASLGTALPHTLTTPEIPLARTPATPETPFARTPITSRTALARTPDTSLGPTGTLPLTDPINWLLYLSPSRRPRFGGVSGVSHPRDLTKPGEGGWAGGWGWGGGSGEPAVRVRAVTGRAVLVRHGPGGRRRARRVPRWRRVRWREGDELWAGASTLVLRGRPGAPCRPPGGRPRWWARTARLAPALVGAATAGALAVTLHQPVLALGALSALLLVGQRPAPPEPHPLPEPHDEPTDLAALRVALAAGGPERRVGPGVPWEGDLAVVGPRAAALATARGLLLTALAGGPAPVVAVRTDRPEEWAWLAWCRPAREEDAPALVVLDGPHAADAWPGPARVLRLPGGDAPAWSRTVLAVDGRAARWREAGGPWRAAPLVGVCEGVAERTARALGRARPAALVAPAAPGRPGAPGDGPPWLPLDRCPADVALGALPGVPAADPVAIARTWRTARGLVLPLGAGPDGAPVTVDLVADGPHAIVAGTTGSGKSQLLTTLVVALAATHPPGRLAVLLVDFKGGTGLGVLAGLPHVVGHLSDLDAAGARRTLRGLAAELHRRERVLTAHGASDVRELDPADAPPRLVVVIDEFRVLADELPDLLPSLARLAAQGRSLGVHLVLATQRPAGAVPADLRANVALRVVLRVADAADSAELVGTGDAARIERPGLALLARGAGRAEHVQVARAVPRRYASVRLAAPWTDGGWVPPRGDAGARPPGDDEGTAAWVAAIRGAAAGRPRAVEPWLPPLPARVLTSEVPAGPGLPLALADLPDDLARGPVRWDPDAGHLLVVGGPGSGRSTALAAVAAAGLAAGRAMHAVGLPPGLRPPGLASVLDGDDVPRVARLVRLLADAPPSPGPRPILVLDDIAAVLAELAGLARGAPAERLEQLWATAGGGCAIVAGGALGPATARIAPGFADRLVLGSPDPTADLLAGVPAGLAGPRPVPGRAIHLGRGGAVLCQVALPDRSPAGERERTGALRVRPLPASAVRPAQVPAVTADGVALGVGGDGAEVVRARLDAPLLVVGPPGSGRSAALDALAAAVAGTGGLVVRLPDPGGAPPPDALLVADDLDEAEGRDPALADALAARLASGEPLRLVAATTTAHAVSAFRGPVSALVRSRRLLVLDPAEPGSADLLGPEGAWLVDRRRPPGRAVLRLGRRVVPLQLWAPGGAAGS